MYARKVMTMQHVSAGLPFQLTVVLTDELVSEHSGSQGSHAKRAPLHQGLVNSNIAVMPPGNLATTPHEPVSCFFSVYLKPFFNKCKSFTLSCIIPHALHVHVQLFLGVKRGGWVGIFAPQQICPCPKERGEMHPGKNLRSTNHKVGLCVCGHSQRAGLSAFESLCSQSWDQTLLSL